jgi:hypothetical protein
VHAFWPKRHLGKGLLHINDDERSFGGQGLGHGVLGAVKDGFMLTERHTRRKHQRRPQEDKICQVWQQKNLG